MVSLEPGHECKYSLSEAWSWVHFFFLLKMRKWRCWRPLEFYSQEVHGCGALRLGLKPMSLAKKIPLEKAYMWWKKMMPSVEKTIPSRLGLGGEIKVQKTVQLVESHRAPPCQTPVRAQQLLVQISHAVTCGEADGSGSLSAMAEKF